MNIAVYCGSDFGNQDVYKRAATELGKWIGKTIYQGAPAAVCNETHYRGNMSERKQQMLELADVFLALPGGIGTLDEISEVITLTKIGVFQKPCILFNRNSFYEPLKTMFTQMEQAGFWWKESMRHVLFRMIWKRLAHLLKHGMT